MKFKIKKSGITIATHNITANNSDLLIKTEPELRTVQNINPEQQKQWINRNITEIRKLKREKKVNKVYDLNKQIFLELEED